MAKFEVNDRVRIRVGGETEYGTITARREGPAGAAVTVRFFHKGNLESIEYHENDGALSRIGPVPRKAVEG